MGCYAKHIQNNKFMNCHELSFYDNTNKNVSIPTLYNDFIKDKVLENKKNHWIVFCHQDFAFLQDPISVLQNLDTNCIYGIAGAGIKSKFDIKKIDKGFVKKEKFVDGFLNQGFFSDRYIAPNENYFKENNHFMIGGLKIKYINGLFFVEKGKMKKDPVVVDTVDCCCLIVHSSLIKKYKMKFDENFAWHLYSEDFSLNAKYNYKVKTKVIFINCYHLSPGFNQSQDFKDSLVLLRKKYKGKVFAGRPF